MRIKSLVVVILLVLIIPAQTFPLTKGGQKRAWDVRNSFRIKNISYLQVAPDGETLYFVVSERNVQENCSYSSLWALPLKGGKACPLTELKSSVSHPRLSPDGKKIAFFSSSEGKFGLWIMNHDGAEKCKLTELEKSNAYLGMKGNEITWSPDGTQLAYNAAGPRHYSNIPSPQNPPNSNDVMVVERLLYKGFYYYSDLRRTYVWVISAEGGKPKQISFGDYDYHSISWSPDGSRVACVSNRTGRDDFNANNDICLLSTEGRDMIQLTNTIGPEYTPYWSPDGLQLAYLCRLRDHRSKESDAELRKVYVIPAEGGETINLTTSLDRWSMSPTWSRDSRTVYFSAQNSGRVGLYTAPAVGGKVDCVFEEDGRVEDFCLGSKGEVFLVYQDFTHPPEIFCIDQDGSEKEQMTYFNQSLVDEVEIIDSERFAFPSFDGLEIEGWIMKPYGFQESKKYPLIHAIHGGPHWQYGYSLLDTVKYQLYAAHGYAVMFINYRGSTGHGQAFSDACVGDLCGGEYKDLMVGLDYALGKFNFIDPARLAVTGVSYGGYLTNWVITQTDRYKAAVPISSISNIISVWGTDANPLWFESDGGFIPFEDYERAWSMSPLKYVKNCQTPTLFINGAWDFCTNLNQAEEMFTALKKLGVDAVLAIYPNEGHGVHNQPKHTFDYHMRALSWFDKYLK